MKIHMYCMFDCLKLCKIEDIKRFVFYLIYFNFKKYLKENIRLKH